MFALRQSPTPDIISKDELDKVYKCDDCDAGGWGSETEVELHRRQTHAQEIKKILNKENACLCCGRELEDEEALLSHIKTDHFYSSAASPRIEREIFICDYCNNVLFNKDLLAFHIMHKHKRIITLKPLQCLSCPCEVTPSQVYSHFQSRHQAQSVAACPVCGSKRASRRELRGHVRGHRKHYHCGTCGFMGTKEKDFLLHLETYKSRPVNKVTNYKHCFVPSDDLRHKNKFSYMRVGNLLMGSVIQHNLAVCVLCRQICRRGDEMLTHVARDHTTTSSPEIQPRHTCSCGETFTTGILLKHHAFRLQGDHVPLGLSTSYQFDNFAVNVECNAVDSVEKDPTASADSATESVDPTSEYVDPNSESVDPNVEYVYPTSESIDPNVVSIDPTVESEDIITVIECETSEAQEENQATTEE